MWLQLILERNSRTIPWKKGKEKGKKKKDNEKEKEKEKDREKERNRKKCILYLMHFVQMNFVG